MSKNRYEILEEDDGLLSGSNSNVSSNSIRTFGECVEIVALFCMLV